MIDLTEQYLRCEDTLLSTGPPIASKVVVFIMKGQNHLSAKETEAM